MVPKKRFKYPKRYFKSISSMPKYSGKLNSIAFPAQKPAMPNFINKSFSSFKLLCLLA